MTITNETQNIISFLEEINENKLRKPNDLAIIIDISSQYDGLEELDILTFYGTSIHYIDNSIRKASPSAEGTDNLYSELKKSLEIFRETLTKYIEFLSDDMKKRFNDIYLESSQGALRNIIDLSYDFSLFKKLQISAKEKK